MGKKCDNQVVVGVDVGGTKILIGCVDSVGNVHFQKKYSMDRLSQDTAIMRIFTALDDFMKEIAGRFNPSAIGVGLVGNVDYRRGVWMRAMNIPISKPVGMADDITGFYGIPTVLDNDVFSATQAEMVFGAGKKYSDFIYVNVGTGISAGMVCNGKLVRGSANFAGEFGHMIVGEGQEMCVCGRRGCIETVSSGGGMVQRAQAVLDTGIFTSLRERLQRGRLTAGLIFEEARSGDAVSCEIAESAIIVLGRGITNLVNLLNTEAVILGGGVFQDSWFVDRIRKYVLDNVLKISKESLKTIAKSELEVNLAGMLGAASIAWNHLNGIKNCS